MVGLTWMPQCWCLEWGTLLNLLLLVCFVIDGQTLPSWLFVSMFGGLLCKWSVGYLWM